MTRDDALLLLAKLEAASAPAHRNGFLLPGKAMSSQPRGLVEAHSRMNRGRSGKMWTTAWKINGRRIARNALIDLISEA